MMKKGTKYGAESGSNVQENPIEIYIFRLELSKEQLDKISFEVVRE